MKAYPKYEERFNEFKKEMPQKIENDIDDILYVKWLRTLKKLIDNNSNNAFPSFMKNDKWKKKKLETLLVVTLNLRLDTILYNKQTFVAEQGKGGLSDFNDSEVY